MAGGDGIGQRLQQVSEVARLLRAYGCGSETRRGICEVLNHALGETSPLVAAHNDATLPPVYRGTVGELLLLLGRLDRGADPIDPAAAATRIEELVERLANVPASEAQEHPITPDPCDVAIGAWLLQATPQWSTVADDKLTHAMETALNLLVRAGLFEQRFSVRAWMDGFTDEVRAECHVSGEYDAELASQLILCGSGWTKDGRTLGAFRREIVGPRSVRLTVNGERAKADWQAGRIDHLLSFVRGGGVTRPPCRPEIVLRRSRQDAPVIPSAPPRLSADDLLTLKTICRWKETAQSEIDDIEGWRGATDERPSHTVDPSRGWRPMPNGFYGDTADLSGIITARYPKLDPTPLHEFYSAVEAWHADLNAARIPPQAVLFTTLEKAMLVLNSVELSIELSRRVTNDKPTPAADLPSGDDQATPATGTTDTRPKNINARMLEAIQSNPEAIGWKLRQWAAYLKCAKSSVAETQTWRDLGMRRERERAEKARDRRRRPPGSRVNKARGHDAE